MEQFQLRDFPPRADVETQIFRPLPSVHDFPAKATIDSDAEEICSTVLSMLSGSVQGSQSTPRLEDLFLRDGAYWRDTLAFTYHLRTFKSRKEIARAFRDLNPRRQSFSFEIIPGSTKPVSAGPSLVSH